MDAARPQVRNSREGRLEDGQGRKRDACNVAVTTVCFLWYNLLLLPNPPTPTPSYHIAITIYPQLLASLPSSTTNTQGRAQTQHWQMLSWHTFSQPHGVNMPAATGARPHSRVGRYCSFFHARLLARYCKMLLQYGRSWTRAFDLMVSALNLAVTLNWSTPYKAPFLQCSLYLQKYCSTYMFAVEFQSNISLFSPSSKRFQCECSLICSLPWYQSSCDISYCKKLQSAIFVAFIEPFKCLCWNKIHLCM